MVTVLPTAQLLRAAFAFFAVHLAWRAPVVGAFVGVPRAPRVLHSTAGTRTSGVQVQLQLKLQVPTNRFQEASGSHVARLGSPGCTGTALKAVLTAEENHARAAQVFAEFDVDGNGTISAEELEDMLSALDIEATHEEAEALFIYLDSDGDGTISMEEFLPWYNQAASSANEVAESFQSMIIGRRTVEHFDETPVNDDVLRRAVQCAIAAPNRSCSEPWRFIKVGADTVKKFARIQKNMETDVGGESTIDWMAIPGWCVVTSKRTPDNPEMELEDFRSTSCALQNFMLSMWSEGIGTKWTR